MTTKTTIGRWFAAPLLIGALTLTACGSDDDADATPAGEATPATAAEAEAETSETTGYEEFCTALDVYVQSAAGPDEEADPADFEPVVAAAPPEIADDMQDILELSFQISEFDLENPFDEEDEEVAEFWAAVDEFDALVAELEPVWAANCPNVDLGGDDTATDDGAADAELDDGSSNESDVSPPAEGLVTEAADVPDPLFDPMFDDDVIDLSELSIDGIRYHLDVNYPDAPWRTGLMAFTIFASVQVGGVELDDVAPEVCNAVAEYVATFEPDWEITIESYAQDDTGQYDYVGDLISATAENGC